MTFEITDQSAIERIYNAFEAEDWPTAYSETFLALSDVIEQDVYDQMGNYLGSTTYLVRKQNVDPAVETRVAGTAERCKP